MYLILYILAILIFQTSTEIKRVSLRGYNPGKCNETNHGNLIMVKDRQDNDKLLVCAEENKEYVWKTTDGSKPTGEFFNPAYDCSDVLNKMSEAKDGMYWVKLPGKGPNKVYCDMTTDAGGWVLVGRKNSSVTWGVPSNDNPVEPYGEPHWSSSLGDSPVLDFRVQVATEEDFTSSKAHWSFRLRHKRPLKNLLIVNEGGCGRLSPGIGDISFVKDLQTEEVVTTTFRCSHFGSNYPRSSKFGWDMMNFCLEHPCPFGFAFHHKFPLQIDHSGAFSYSAIKETSGISENSTSFVGCDNRKCCGCFGPVGGKRNYCGTECTAKNGGTIVKNVYTWFWVRSSLPKKIWNKCMEYKVTVAEGHVVWYKLYDGNPVPMAGRCDQKAALLNDGIVVVADSAAANRVPAVPGLLLYRKDDKKLYVRSNNTWNVLGEEKQVLEKTSNQFETKLNQGLAKTSNQFETKLNQGLEKTSNQFETKLNQREKKLLESLNELKSQLANNTKILNHMNEAMWKSCSSLYKAGKRDDGIYTINPDGLASFKVWCDMQTDRGGWTVLQRRLDSSVDFNRAWKEYKFGFGDLSGNFWLGLDKIHRLTKSGQNVLRVDLMDFDNTEAYAKYGTFSVASESEHYTLRIGSFSGNAGDSLAFQNGMKFSTKDRDNDRDSGSCAKSWKSGWWFKACHMSHLNGQYLSSSSSSPGGTTWYNWKNDWRSMKKASMKIRPAQF